MNITNFEGFTGVNFIDQIPDPEEEEEYLAELKAKREEELAQMEEDGVKIEDMP